MIGSGEGLAQPAGEFVFLLSMMGSLVGSWSGSARIHGVNLSDPVSE
jgi:hypothetical protein